MKQKARRRQEAKRRQEQKQNRLPQPMAHPVKFPDEVKPSRKIAIDRQPREPWLLDGFVVLLEGFGLMFGSSGGTAPVRLPGTDHERLAGDRRRIEKDFEKVLDLPHKRTG